MTRHITLLFIGIITLGIITACHKEEDDIFTTASVSITIDGNTNPERVQGQAVFTNINSRKETASAEFTGNTITLELLKGPYLVSIEGVLSYHDENGSTAMHQFRAQTDYAEFMQNPTAITLKAILLD